MKKYRFFTMAITLAMAALVISCDRDDDIIVQEDNRVEVQFTSNIVTINNPPKSKASGNTWGAFDAIGVYMYEESDVEVVDNMKNIEYVTEAGGQSGSFKAASTVIYFPDNGEKVRFMAYYPYLEGVQSINDIYPVNVTDQSSQPAIDLLYSFNTAKSYDKTTPNKKVPLVFDHQLTKVYVNVKAGEGLVAADLQKLTITFDGLNTTANFNLKDGSLNNAGSPADINLKGITAKDGYIASFESIVLPSATVPTAQIKFDLNNGDELENIESDTYTWIFNNTLEKSTKYTYNVTINRSGIVVEATINDWTPGDEVDIDAE